MNTTAYIIVQSKLSLLILNSSTYIDFYKENNERDPKFTAADKVRISKYNNFFAKDSDSNWSEVFMISKAKNTVWWAYLISYLKGEEIVGTIYETKLQKTNQKEFRMEKVIKTKSKNYTFWKVYDNTFNSWIDKKYIVI